MLLALSNCVIGEYVTTVLCITPRLSSSVSWLQSQKSAEIPEVGVCALGLHRGSQHHAVHGHIHLPHGLVLHGDPFGPTDPPSTGPLISAPEEPRSWYHTASRCQKTYSPLHSSPLCRASLESQDCLAYLALMAKE